MACIELRRQATEHFLVGTAAIIGFDEFGFAFKITDANIFANAAPRGGQLRKGGGERFHAQPRPAHAALEEQRVAEGFAVIGANIDKNAATLAAKEILEQEPVLPDLRIEFHGGPRTYTASTPDTSGM